MQAADGPAAAPAPALDEAARRKQADELRRAQRRQKAEQHCEREGLQGTLVFNQQIKCWILQGKAGTVKADLAASNVALARAQGWDPKAVAAAAPSAPAVAVPAAAAEASAVAAKDDEQRRKQEAKERLEREKREAKERLEREKREAKERLEREKEEARRLKEHEKEEARRLKEEEKAAERAEREREREEKAARLRAERERLAAEQKAAREARLQAERLEKALRKAAAEREEEPPGGGLAGPLSPGSDELEQFQRFLVRQLTKPKKARPGYVLYSGEGNMLDVLQAKSYRDARSACGGGAPQALQPHQVITHAMARLRAEDRIRTPGLLVNHSTGAGKTLIGVGVLLAFWNKTIASGHGRGHPVPVFLVSTSGNQKENSLDKLATLAVTYFGDAFRQTIDPSVPERPFSREEWLRCLQPAAEDEESAERALRCSEVRRAYAAFLKEHPEAGVSAAETQRGSGPGVQQARRSDGSSGSIKEEGDAGRAAAGKGSEPVEWVPSSRRASGPRGVSSPDPFVSWAVHVIRKRLGAGFRSVMAQQLPERAWQHPDDTPNVPGNQAFVDFHRARVRDGPYGGLFTFTLLGNNLRKALPADSAPVAQARRADEESARQAAAQQEAKRKRKLQLLVGEEGAAAADQPLDKRARREAAARRLAGGGAKPAGAFSESGSGDEDDEDAADSPQAQPGQLFQNIVREEEGGGYRMRNAVFVVDEVQFLLSPPATDAAHAPQFRMVREVLTRMRDPATTWVVGMTATPGETKAELCAILGAVAGDGRFADPAAATASYAEFKRRAAGLVSFAQLQGDFSHFPNLVVRRECVPMGDRYGAEYRAFLHEVREAVAGRKVRQPRFGKVRPGQFSYEDAKRKYLDQFLQAGSFLRPSTGRDGEDALFDGDDDEADAELEAAEREEEERLRRQKKKKKTAAAAPEVGAAELGDRRSPTVTATARNGATSTFLLSPKLMRVVRNIVSSQHKGKHYVYTSSKRTLQLVATMLRRHGYSLLNPQADGGGRRALSKAPRYALLDNVKSRLQPFASAVVPGAQSAAYDVKAAARVTDHRRNADGSYVRVILGTSESFKGVDRNNIRYLHLVDSLVDWQDFVQFMGRGPRNCSHPSGKRREVKLFVYQGVLQPGRCTADTGDCRLWDEALARQREQWEVGGASLDEWLMRASVDHDVFGGNLHRGMHEFMDRVKALGCGGEASRADLADAQPAAPNRVLLAAERDAQLDALEARYRTRFGAARRLPRDRVLAVELPDRQPARFRLAAGGPLLTADQAAKELGDAEDRCPAPVPAGSHRAQAAALLYLGQAVAAHHSAEALAPAVAAAVAALRGGEENPKAVVSQLHAAALPKKRKQHNSASASGPARLLAEALLKPGSAALAVVVLRDADLRDHFVDAGSGQVYRTIAAVSSRGAALSVHVRCAMSWGWWFRCVSTTIVRVPSDQLQRRCDLVVGVRVQEATAGHRTSPIGMHLASPQASTSGDARTASTRTASTRTASTRTASTRTASTRTASTRTASTRTASTRTASTRTASTRTASTRTISDEAMRGGNDRKPLHKQVIHQKHKHSSQTRDNH